MAALMTVPEVAERLKVHQDTVKRWLRSGELRGVLFGRKAGWRVTEDDLQRFINDHRPERAIKEVDER